MRLDKEPTTDRGVIRYRADNFRLNRTKTIGKKYDVKGLFTGGIHNNTCLHQAKSRAFDNVVLWKYVGESRTFLRVELGALHIITSVLF